jgi:hemoglobin-like flavoprotein
MATTERDLELFNDTLDRCLHDPAFLEVFYDTLIGASPEVGALFANTSLRRQRRALKASLYAAMLAADRHGPALAHVDELAVLHRRMQITPPLYDLWLDCLIDAARRVHPGFDGEAEAAWRHVLGVAIERMKAPAAEG